AKGHGKWGRLSFAYFSLATQRKVGAPPGAHPGLRRHQKHYAFNSFLRPPRLDKTPISFKNRSTQSEHHHRANLARAELPLHDSARA
ncbi:hypothetical protein, partial [Ottowia sp.]|uniref:hypothetical protein n=1 Tax=Ottowia sp. TaxID=1898956 RepID=UPI00345F0D16